MMKEISSIEICVANFKKPTCLNLFDPTDGNKIKTTKGALLYGRNVSGKSTIAGEMLPTISRATIFDKDYSPYRRMKGKIFLFLIKNMLIRM